jgi:methionyl-tRNA formyltransferase
MKEVIEPIRQNPSNVTFCYKIQKSDSIVNLDSIKAQDLLLHFRAFLKFPRTRIINDVDILGNDFKITKVGDILDAMIDNLCKINTKYLIVTNDKKFYLRCGDYKYLEILQILDKNGRQITLKGLSI